MRRALLYLVTFLAAFALLCGVRLLAGADDLGDVVLTSLRWAGVGMVGTFLGQAFQLRRRGDGTYVAAWRTYDGGRPSRWRHGWARNAGNAVDLTPRRGGVGGVRLPLPVRAVAHRPVRVRETVVLNPSMDVLEATLADAGRVDVAVPAHGVAEVRGWLGQGR